MPLKFPAQWRPGSRGGGRRGGPRSAGRALGRRLDVSSPPASPPGIGLVPSGLWNGLDEVDGEVLLVEAAGRRAPGIRPNGERGR